MPSYIAKSFCPAIGSFQERYASLRQRGEQWMQRCIPGTVGEGVEASLRTVLVAELDSPIAPAVGLVNPHVDMCRVDSMRTVEVWDETLYDPAVEGQEHRAEDLVMEAHLDHALTVATANGRNCDDHDESNDQLAVSHEGP